MKFFLVIIALSFCMMSSISNDYLFIGGWGITMANIVSLRNQSRVRINFIDLILIIYFCFNLFSIFWNKIDTPYYYGIASSFITTSLYFLCRNTLNKEDSKKILPYICIYLILIIAIAVPTFLNNITELRTVKWDTYISEFKFIITPYGMPLNVWGSLSLYGFIILICSYLIFRPYDYFKHGLYLVGIGLCLFLLLLTFIRGIYICFTMYLLAVIIIGLSHENKRIQILLLISTCLISFIITLLFCKEDIVKTFSMFETYSQQQSFFSRICAIDYVKYILNTTPILGTGINNVSYYIHMTLDQDSEIPFLGNTFFQIIVESGVVGLILILCALILLIRSIVYNKDINPIYKKFITISIVIFILREATFPSFSQSVAIQSLIFVLLAIFQNCTTTSQLFVINKRLLITCSLFFCIFEGYNLSAIAKNINITTVSTYHINNENWGEALHMLNDADTTCFPICFNKAIIHWNLYRKYGNKSNQNESKRLLEKCKYFAHSDYIITFNYIQCLKQLGLNEQSTTLLDSINLIHSNKMVSNWYKLLSTNSDSILIQNIYKNPRLLYSNEYRSYFDTISKNRFKKIKLLIFNKNDAHDAKAKAKLGRIKLWAGDTIGASILLSESLRLLPNLIEPRNYMSKIDKTNANLYENQYTIITKHRPDTVINETCIEEYYKNNFTFWYGGTVSSKYIVF